MVDSNNYKIVVLGEGNFYISFIYTLTQAVLVCSACGQILSNY